MRSAALLICLTFAASPPPPPPSAPPTPPQHPALPAFLTTPEIPRDLPTRRPQRPAVDLETLFLEEAARRCKALQPPPHDKYNAGPPRNRFEDAFRLSIVDLHVLDQFTFCATVSEEELPVLVGYIAGNEAVRAVRHQAYTDLLDSLRRRKDNAYYTTGAVMLHQAVAANDVEGLRFLLSLRIDPNLRGETGVTALHRAIAAGRPQLVRILLHHRASVHQAYGPYQESPLRAAVRAAADEEDVVAVIDLILKQGLTIDAPRREGDRDDRNILIHAHGEKVIKRLIEGGADVHALNSDGLTLLHSTQSIEVAQALIDAGADVNGRTADGATPLDTNANEAVQDLLRRKGGVATRFTPEWKAMWNRLDERISFHVKDVALEWVIDFFIHATGIPTRIDWPALEAAGVNRAQLITLQPDDEARPMQELMRLAFGQVSVPLAFDVDTAGTLLIGTADSVRRLLAGDVIGPGPADGATLAQAGAMKALLDRADVSVREELTTIREALIDIATLAGRPPRIDWPALRKLGLRPDRRIPQYYHHAPRRRTLDYLLADGGAARWVIEVNRDGEVVISGADE